jgi:RNA polymerase sigma-54 factor
VEAESLEHPLSDEALAQALAGVGLTLSRRTVAKYRSELSIPPAAQRRRKA